MNQRRKKSHSEQEIKDLRLLRPAHGGFCVGFDDSGVIFVRQGLPGELVDVKTYDAKGRVRFAQVTKVKEPSEWRRESIWKTATESGLGGAELAHVHPAYQLQWKTEVLADTLRRIGSGQTAEAFSTFFSNEEAGPVLAQHRLEGEDGKRTRAEFVVDANGRLAMHKVASMDLVAVDEYPLGTAAIANHEIFSSDSAFAELLHESERIRIIDTADGVFVRIGQQWYNKHAHPIPIGLVHYRVGDSLLAADPNGFWQAGKGSAELLSDTVRELMPAGDEPVLELFSGAGLLSRVVSAQTDGHSRYVLAVEGNEMASRIGPKNAPQAHHLAAEISVQSLGELINQLPQKPFRVLADPPRQGLGAQLVRELVASKPLSVLLVSCDPAAFAADAKQLGRLGYLPQKLTILDLFPDTHHFETVCLFEPIPNS
ncbi:hypothetical protein BSR28_04435 [Boudabousia liubingyangii]|uniref:class I SAM-dependent RNA methyltransferase n=1 Tax=Boudabousia liubingyangii TaxID=1921764 RepID=UPI0009402AAF|nr:class I SAM-dependent RNA methyltransferase [Boudabousia liubingyangii]OKL47735.1 hypothetical protein BSR28_04435 [Boudabousia liubingyangii]